ncbi:porin [Comamonas sp. w2-DMI]|uniref:Porin n=1 Tax=Comamonas terrae TaxID=673548 RepID=A0ABW5UHI3_9BURK
MTALPRWRPALAGRTALSSVLALPALAAALFSLPSAAQQAPLGTLQIYGRLNTSVERSRVQGRTAATGLLNNESFWGLRGQEDLGGGMQAGFILENGFELDTGRPSERAYFNRKSEVNLSGRLGMLRMGRLISEAYYATADVVNMHNFDTGTSADALYAWVSNGGDHVSWRLPPWRGLTVEIGSSLHEKREQPAHNAWDLAAHYEHGALSLGLGYGRWGAAEQATLRATYVQGPWTLTGYHQTSTGWDNASHQVDSSQRRRHLTRLAIQYADGPSEYHANLGHAGKAGGQARTQALQWTLAYNYHFSKRTKLYALYTRLDNRAGAHYLTGEDGVGFSSVALGMRHYF